MSTTDHDGVPRGWIRRMATYLRPHRAKVATANLRVLPTFLVDGMVAGTWRIERAKSSAVLLLDPFRPLTRKERTELTGEGTALVRFVESDARTVEVR